MQRAFFLAIYRDKNMGFLKKYWKNAAVAAGVSLGVMVAVNKVPALRKLVYGS